MLIHFSEDWKEVNRSKVVEQISRALRSRLRLSFPSSMATYTPSRIGSPGVGLSTPSHNPTNTSANTTLFRRLVWEGTVPLEIRIDGKELPADADRGLDSYYVSYIFTIWCA